MEGVGRCRDILFVGDSDLLKAVIFGCRAKRDRLLAVRKAFREGGPGRAVVVFAVAAGEGGFVGDGAFVGAAGEGVLEDGTGDGGVGEVADVLPAEGEVGSGRGRRGWRV